MGAPKSLMRGKEMVTGEGNAGEQGDWRKPGYECHDEGDDGKEGQEYSKEEVNKALAIMEVERTLKNVNNYKRALQESPDGELQSLMNALNGGYTAPSPGGDPIVNPNTLPTDGIFLL